MNEQLAYIYTIDTRILQNSNKKVAEFFITKYREEITNHFGPDMERFQPCFETALFAIGEWQKKVDAMTRYHEENEVMEFFSSIPPDEAGNLATSILLFSDVLAMKGADEVFSYFLGKDDIV
ncbi:Uncharacterised protein [Salmonella enterica subsp. enterica serovar Sanjuan]|uniref:Uncharacterized protein n=1 Tax=Salmonella enterica subsp. enterica serovar Sanjuan TaxID=1160765 RepID=A0A3S4ITQ6_SALET|nr:hypothetical protein [Salmonella enterica]EIE9113752.1 hypothetical protein [Salmonella enterica]EJY5269716.1 hypothetical protein [Salmonella enterica]ELM9752064.1 hypothetical protein [Salmonella enterica]VEA07897.1 Uncharacterised protein [Salmonella enterica subsp. enterica serovar Sanjuan]